MYEPAGGKCKEGAFACGDGSCVAEKVQCNREFDCYDMSDEFECGECASGQCYLPTQRPTCSTVGLMVTDRLIA